MINNKIYDMINTNNKIFLEFFMNEPKFYI